MQKPVVPSAAQGARGGGGGGSARTAHMALAGERLLLVGVVVSSPHTHTRHTALCIPLGDSADAPARSASHTNSRHPTPCAPAWQPPPPPTHKKKQSPPHRLGPPSPHPPPHLQRLVQGLELLLAQLPGGLGGEVLEGLGQGAGTGCGDTCVRVRVRGGGGGVCVCVWMPRSEGAGHGGAQVGGGGGLHRACQSLRLPPELAADSVLARGDAGGVEQVSQTWWNPFANRRTGRGARPPPSPPASPGPTPPHPTPPH